MRQELVRPLFNFGKYLQKANACQKLFWKQDILKKHYQKTLKKLTYFFFQNLTLFYEWNYEKQKEPEASYQSHFSLQNVFRKIYYF